MEKSFGRSLEYNVRFVLCFRDGPKRFGIYRRNKDGSKVVVGKDRQRGTMEVVST